jgi:hypothetical protein
MSTALTNPRTDGAYAVTVDIPFIVAGRPPLWGNGALSGTVTVASVPAARVVEVYDEATLTLAASTKSASDGTWSLSGLTTTRPLRLIVHGVLSERDVTIGGLYAT